MRNPVEKCCCHLCIPEDRDPFAELKVGGDDHAGFLIELADEVEQQRTAGLWKRDITQLVDDHAVQWCKLPDDLPGISISLLFDQRIDQIDRVKEASLFTLVDQIGCQGNGNMGFTRSSTSHQNEIVGILGKLARTEGFDLRLPNSSRAVMRLAKSL